jgi:IclR family pca regulon transcriptional regulator
VGRCLITLSTLGYIETTGKYFRLTAEVLTLSQPYFSSSPLPISAQHYIEKISNIVGESCSVSVLVGDEVIYVARSSRKRSASIHREAGVNLPAYCTSMGRVLLANLPKIDLDSYLGRVILTKYNNKTVVDKTELQEILEAVRQDEYCIIDGELELGLRAVAVPVRNTLGKIIAAAHISTDANRTTIKKIKNEFLPILRRGVTQIRRALDD